MLQAIKLTFGSVWGWLGIIVGAISLINLGVMYFEVGIGPVLERVVETYRAIVHQGFDYLFFWVDWKMPPWAKDGVAAYTVFGFASFRGMTQVDSENELESETDMAVIFTVLWPVVLWLTVIEFSRSKQGEYEFIDLTLLLNFLVVPLLAAAFVSIESGI